MCLSESEEVNENVAELSIVGGVRCNRCKRLWHDACTGLSGQLDVCLICDPDQELFHASPSHVVEEQEPLTPDQCKNGVEVVHEQYGRGVVIEAPVPTHDDMLTVT